MKKIFGLVFVVLLLAGCPRKPPVAHTANMTTTLPSATINCVTVHRNPQTNEAETVSCIDSLTVSAPQHLNVTVTEVNPNTPTDVLLFSSTQHLSANIDEVNPATDTVIPTETRQLTSALQETQTSLDLAAVSHGTSVSVAETSTTTDTFWCPQHAVAAMIENNTTTDALTCGG